MKFVKNYMKNLTKSTVYIASDIGKNELAPNIGEFVSANKEVFSTTYGLLRNPKQQVKKSVEYFRQSKIYQAIDYGARNTFDDLRTGKWYNKERDEQDEGRLAGLSADDYNDLSEFGISDDWDKEIAQDTGRTDEVTTGDMKIVETIEKTSAASATTTSAAIAVATDIGVKNSRTNTAMIYNQNERLFGGLHNDVSVLNATLNSLMKFQTETFKNLDNNTSKFFTESVKLDTERNAMIKELLEMQRNSYKTAIQKEQEAIQNDRDKKKKKRRYGDIVLRDGMPDLGEYFENIKENINTIIKNKTSGMMGGFGEDGNMLAAMVTSPLKFVLEPIVSSLIPQTLKEATKEFDSIVSGVFGTVLAKLGNTEDGSILSKLNSIFGIKNTVNKNIDTSRYDKGPVPFDGITRKAIVDVIPTYLRRIESALTGREESIYDYKNGRWTTFKEAEEQYKNIHKSAIRRATNDLRSKMLGAKKKMAIKDYRTDKELNDAIDEFMEVLYDRNGDFNPSKSLEENGIMGKQNLARHYDQVMRLYSNFDAIYTKDKKGNITGLRNRNLSNRLIAGNVFDARSGEERAYREAELDPANIISTFFEGKGNSNLVGRFSKDENGKEKWKYKNNLLLISKDKHDMNVFDYLRNINMELRWQREEAFQYYVAGVGGSGGPTGGGKRKKKRGNKEYYSNHIPPQFNAKKFATDKPFVNINLGGSIKSLANDAKNVQSKDESFKKATLSAIEKGQVAPWLYQTGEDNEQKELLEKLQNYIITKNTEDFEKELFDKSNANTISKLVNGGNSAVISYKKRQEMEAAVKELEKDDDNDKDIDIDDDKDEGFFKNLLGNIKKSKEFVAGLITGPTETFTNLLYTADRAIYDMLFKQKILKDDNDEDTNEEEYDGFINFLVGKTKNAFKKISDKFTDTILNPLREKLGVGDDFKDEFIDSTKKIGKSILGKFVTANKEVYSPLIENIKEELGLGEKKDNENSRERHRREIRENDLENLKKVTNRDFSVTNTDIYNMIKHYGGNPLEFENTDDQADYLIQSIAKSIYDNSDSLKDDLTEEEFNLVFNTYLNSDDVTTADLGKMIKAASLMNEVTGNNKEELLRNFKSEVSKSHAGTNKFNSRDYIDNILKDKQKEYIKNNKGNLPKQYQNKYDTQIESGNLSDSDIENILNKIPNKNLTIRNAIKSTASDLSKNFVNPKNLKSTRNILVEEATNIINNKDYYKDNNKFNIIKDLTANDIVRLGNSDPQSLYKIIGTFGSREDLENKINTNTKARNQYKKQQEFLKNSRDDKENRDAYITNRFRDILNNKSQYSSNKNYNLIKNIKPEDADAIHPNDIKNIIIKLFNKDYWADIIADYQKSTLNNFSNYNAKGTVDGKPFMGDTMLSKGELLFNNNGVSVVPETNAYRLNQPTQILNSYDSHPILKSMGIDLGARKTPSQDLANENKVKNRIFKNNAKGTIPNHDTGTIKIRQGSEINVDEVIEKAKSQLPEMAAGGMFGGILSLVLGLVGGPLLGAAVGAGSSLIASSDDLKDKLFGEKDNKTGKRKGGKLFNGKIMDAVNRYLPDMTKYGLAGIIPGLLTPLGPIGGLLVGGAIGAIKNNEAFTNRYFGEEGRLTLKSDTKKKFDKAFKPALAGGTAGIIAKALGFGLGGPLGLAGNMVVGSMLGVMTTTDEFKDLMFGMEINGVRHGGIAGTLRDAFEPLKDFGTDVKNKLFEVIDKHIADPLQRFITPTLHSIYNIAGILPRTINRILESHFGKSLKSTLKTITARAGNSIIGKGIKTLGKGAGKIAGALNPLQWLGKFGDAQRAHHIKSGKDTYDTAEERIQFMKDKNINYDDRFDTILAGIGNEGSETYNEAKNMMNIITQLSDTASDVNTAYNKSNKQLRRVLGAYHTSDGGSFTNQQIKDITKAIKAGDIDSVRNILRNTSLSNNRALSDEEYRGLMNSVVDGDGENLNSLLTKNLDLRNRKNKVGTYYRTQKDKEADAGKVKEYLARAGIQVNNSRELRQYANMIQTELTNREAVGSSKTLPESDNAAIALKDIGNTLEEMLEIMKADAMGVSPAMKAYKETLASKNEQDDIKSDQIQKRHQDALKSIIGEEAYENMSPEARDKATTKHETSTNNIKKYFRTVKFSTHKFNSSGKKLNRPHVELRTPGTELNDEDNMTMLNKYIAKPVNYKGDSIIEAEETSSDKLMMAPQKALDNIGKILKLGWSLGTEAKEKIVDITVSKSYGQDFTRNLYNILKGITILDKTNISVEELEIIMRDGKSLVEKNKDIVDYKVKDQFDLNSIKDLSKLTFAQIRNAGYGDDYSTPQEDEEQFTNHAFGTILGLGTKALGFGAKVARKTVSLGAKAVGGVAKGAFNGVKKAKDSIKQVLAPSESNDSGAFATVGSNGSFAGYVTNPEHPDETVKYKYNSTGGKEPDTSDAETRDTLNRITLRQRLAEKASKARDKAAETINKAFGNEMPESNKGKLHWWEVLAAGIFAAPYLKKVYDKVIKPVWDDKIYPWIQQTALPWVEQRIQDFAGSLGDIGLNIGEAVGGIGGTLADKLPEIIGKTAAIAIKNLPKNAMTMIKSFWKELQSKDNKDHDKKNTPKDVGGTNYKVDEDGSKESYFYTYDKNNNKVKLTIDDIRQAKYKNIYNEQGTKGTLQDDGKYDFEVINDNGKNGYKNQDLNKQTAKTVVRAAIGGSKNIRFANAVDKTGKTLMKHGGVISKVGGTLLRAGTMPVKAAAKVGDIARSFSENSTGAKGLARFKDAIKNNVSKDGKIAKSVDKAYSSIKNAAGKSKTVKNAAEKVVSKTKGSKVGGYITKLVEKTREALSKILTNKYVTKKFAGSKFKDIADAVLNEVKKNATKLGESGVAKIAQKAGGFVLKFLGPIMTLTDVITGADQAAGILGIENPTLPQRLICGVVKALINIVPMLSLVINEYKICPKIVKKLYGKSFTEQQENAKEIVDSYNKEHGTNLSTDEYLNKDTFTTKATNVVKKVGSTIASGVKTAWNGIKNAGSWIASKASGAVNKVKSFFGGGSSPKYGMGYKQNDPSISNIRFNAPGDTEYQTIGDSGCGPAAAVNAVSSIYGKGNSNPIVGAAKMAIKGGYKERNGGTRPEFFKDYFNKNGLGSSITTNKSQMENSIQSGNPIVLMGKDAKGTSNVSPFGKNPHYVTVTGTDGKGNAVVQDPESKYDNQIYKMKDLVSRSTLGVSTYGRSKYGMGYSASPSKINPNPASEHVPSAVTRYKKTLIEACNKHGVSTEWVDFLMSMMTCETHGSGGDPMQAAEGVGNSSHGTKSGRTYSKKANGITDPIDSCYAGVYELKDRLAATGYKNPYNKMEIMDLAQGYNFGGGFITWLKQNNTHYTLENAIKFGTAHSTGEFAAKGYGCPNHALKVWAVYQTTESGKKAKSGKYGNYQATSSSNPTITNDSSSNYNSSKSNGLFSALSDFMDNSVGGKLYNALNGTDSNSNTSSSDDTSSDTASTGGSIASNANKQQAADLISRAASEIGYKEQGTNLTKFGKWYGMNGQPWCAMFVSYNANKAKIPTNIIPKDASTRSMYSWFKKKNELVSSPSKGEPGDIVFFADANGNESGIHHVGIVEDVSGGEVHTIEGNTSDEVRRRSYKTSEKKLLLARPAYTGPANANKGTSNVKFAKTGGNYNTRGGNKNKPLSKYGIFKDTVKQATDNNIVKPDDNNLLSKYNTFKKDIKKATNSSGFDKGNTLVKQVKEYNKNHNDAKLVVENDQQVAKYGKGNDNTDSATIKLIQTIVTILTEIADNTDKLSTITSILQDKLDVKITSKDISNKTNKESLKAKLKKAITNKSSDTDFINASNDTSLNSIVLAMNSIAAE